MILLRHNRDQVRPGLTRSGLCHRLQVVDIIISSSYTPDDGVVLVLSQKRSHTVTSGNKRRLISVFSAECSFSGAVPADSRLEVEQIVLTDLATE